jgi:hypothetical protein
MACETVMRWLLRTAAPRRNVSRPPRRTNAFGGMNASWAGYDDGARKLPPPIERACVEFTLDTYTAVYYQGRLNSKKNGALDD